MGDTVYINIYHFIYHLRMGNGTLRRFPNLKQLSDYSYWNNKVYNRHLAERSPVLRCLLQPLASCQLGGGGAKKGPRAQARRAPGGRGGVPVVVEEMGTTGLAVAVDEMPVLGMAGLAL